MPPLTQFHRLEGDAFTPLGLKIQGALIDLYAPNGDFVAQTSTDFDGRFGYTHETSALNPTDPYRFVASKSGYANGGAFLYYAGSALPAYDLKTFGNVTLFDAEAGKGEGDAS